MPSGAAWTPVTSPRASSRYARADVVPQSTAISAAGAALTRRRPAPRPPSGRAEASRRLVGRGRQFAIARCPSPPAGARRSRLPPPRGRVVVARARLDPPRAVGRRFLLPERSARLEIIHDELARREGLAPMRARHADEHDLVGGRERPDAMDDERVENVPARLRLVDDRGERLFRHPRIVLQREP